VNIAIIKLHFELPCDVCYKHQEAGTYCCEVLINGPNYSVTYHYICTECMNKLEISKYYLLNLIERGEK